MHYTIGKPVEYRPGKWRCLINISGHRSWGPTKATADEATRGAERAAQEAVSGALTVGEIIESYLEYGRIAGNRERSIETARGQLRRFFGPALGDALVAITPKRVADLYEALRTVPGPRKRIASVSLQQHCLRLAKSMLAWCVEQRLVRSNAAVAVKLIGTPHRGKAQLRLDEARRIVQLGLNLAAAGDDGALAVVMALVLGLRAGEIVSRAVRDIDDGGRLLCVDDAADGWQLKTRAARRSLAVPDMLQPLLRARCDGKSPSALLFEAPRAGGRRRIGWVRASTISLCMQAGVPGVCAHSLRGLHASLAIQAGASPSAVAAALGHEFASMTLSAYASPGSLQIGQQHQAAAQLLPNPRMTN